VKQNQRGAADPIDRRRRRFIGGAGGGVVATMFGGLLPLGELMAMRESAPSIRWGIVGTGSIANAMAGMIKEASSAELAAVSSRRLASAEAFAGKHGVPAAYDSWATMAAAADVDAVYVATPTSVREEICVTAAIQGKHVLGEKPFASLESVRRIAAACRANGVGFMDGTHFVHHPRTAHLRANTDEKIGWPWSLDTAFQFMLADKGNIRFNPSLEPMGAIGDTGWYNMRAATEYLSPDAEISSVSTHIRRDDETGAAISGSGVILFNDGSTTTWNCGFDSGAPIMDLRLTGNEGVASMDNFLSQDRDGSASYLYKSGGWGKPAEMVVVPSTKPGAVLMYEDFSVMVQDNALREQSIAATERTQGWLDAIWDAGLKHEMSVVKGS
jgi:predicted dehydrogenase